MADNHVFVFLVDFDNLEFHCLVDEYIVVADRADVDLRAGEERLDAEHVHDHAAFGAALDIAFDDFVVFESLVDAVPAAGLACLLVGEAELAVLVLKSLYEYLYFIAFLEVGVVAEFADGDDGIGLHAYVHAHVALGDGFHAADGHFIFFYRVERLVVGLHQFLAAHRTGCFATCVGVPIEIFDRGLNF